MIRPTPDSDVVDAVLATFGTAGIGIESTDHDPITFREMAWDGPPEEYIRANTDADGVYVRTLTADASEYATCGTAEFTIPLECHVFKHDADRVAVWRDVGAILWRLAQVVGEEQAKVNGADGAGGLFGDGASTAMSRIVGVTFRGPISKRVLLEENEFWVHGSFGFSVQYRLDVSGGTVNG